MIDLKTVTRENVAHLVGLDTASRYQIDIFMNLAEALREMDQGRKPRSLVVQAAPGSGKTRTIEALCQMIPMNRKAAAMSFGSDPAAELARRVPAYINSSTLNSAGNKILGAYLKRQFGRYPKLDKFKIQGILRENMSEDMIKEVGSEVRALVDHARGIGVVPKSLEREYRNANGFTDTDQFWLDLAEYHEMDIKNELLMQVIDTARKVLVRSIEMVVKNNVIDFNDQLYMTVIMHVGGSPLPCFKYDVLFVDETQDLNPVQLAMIKMLLKPTGMLVAVGDRRQSIYGFRGADTESMDKVRAAFNAVELPLSICYRCGRKIVELAKTVYPDIEPAPNAIEGEVMNFDSYDLSLFQPGDYIVCRNNAPLVAFAFRLIRARKAVRVLGKDIGAGLIAIINKLDHENSVVKLAEELGKWQETQIGIAKRKNQDDVEAVKRIEDRYASVMVFLDDVGSKTVEDIKREIADLFSKDRADKSTLITLSTVHKIKGGEADRVFFLDPNLLFPFWISHGTWQYIQEMNVQFVVYTRARKLFGFIGSNGMKEAA